MTPCKYLENSGLFLEHCPNCHSDDVEESGDDFDGDVGCNKCSLTTYVCYGTRSAIKVWNNRLNIDKWEFLDNEKLKDFSIGL